MKTLNKLLLGLFILGLVTGTGCKKNEDDEPNNNNNPQFMAGNGSISCKIDGADFQKTIEYCALADGTLNLGNFLENDFQMQFTPAAVGTFDMNIGGQGIQNVLFIVLSDGTTLNATSATITIDELNGTTSGTFSASCVDGFGGTQYTVTDGQFSANLF